ncbi:MAG: hypothetical protein JNL07_12295 [Rhodospirillales bacterium]|nr:hypothetical protein [Rhodospirillales bacterium]
MEVLFSIVFEVVGELLLQLVALVFGEAMGKAFGAAFKPRSSAASIVLHGIFGIAAGALSLWLWPARGIGSAAGPWVALLICPAVAGAALAAYAAFATRVDPPAAGGGSAPAANDDDTSPAGERRARIVTGFFSGYLLALGVGAVRHAFAA